MKRFSRALAVLLAAGMLMALLPCALAEELTLEAAEAAEEGLVPGDIDLGLDEMPLPAGDLSDFAGEEEPDAPAPVANDGDYDHEAFTINSKGLLVRYNGDAEEVVVPDGVVAIGNDAFAMNSAIVRVTLPQGLTHIGTNAFYDCASLRRVNIPDGVTAIGKYAFSECPELESISIPGSVATIGKGAFMYCGIERLKLAEGVTRIGEDAFWWCERLETVKIPASVTAIGNTAFAGCASLEKFTVAKGNPKYVARGGLLYNRSLTTLIACPASRTRAAIPAGVRKISDYAFCLTRVSSLILPSGVRSVGGCAFGYSENLGRVVILSKDITIAPNAFEESWCTVYTAPGSAAAGQLEEMDGVELVTDCLLLTGDCTRKASIGDVRHLVTTDAEIKSCRSASKAVASVTRKGEVTARKAGVAAITVTLSGGGSRVLTLKVVDGAKLSRTKLTLKVGASGTLTLTGLAGREVAWSTSDSRVATVKDGVVTAKKAGKCTIKAKVKNGKTLKCAVKVVR